MRGRTMVSSPGRLAAAALISSLPVIHAISYTTVPSPNLDLSQLGRVALAGSFDSISLYKYRGQNQDAFTANGTQSLLTRYPNGAFHGLALSDAYVETMCPFVLKDGTFAGVVVGGNFTSLGNVAANGIALFDPETSKITPLPGLSGQVSSVYCDKESSTVYVGGNFAGGNSTNAIAWTTGWTNLPFAGFNGPVTSITKSSNGTIIFGGSFDGLGNTTTPKVKDMQVINLSAGELTASGTTSTEGFINPSNIICKVGSQDGPGNSWLLADNTPGYWQAKFGFGFKPTKLRLYNTKQDGRGTKTFRFTAMPINGIMNLTYTGTDGQTGYCDAECPLPPNNVTYQDFHFVNVIGMNAFRLDVSAWYGKGGGFSGIELFQDEIQAFAIPRFNEPLCDGVSKTGANSTATGPWRETASGTSTSDYLTAVLASGTAENINASVVFRPDIKQSGNYSITMFTPGCYSDATCSTRGIVNITGSMTSQRDPVTTTLYQSNNYDKYDQIYFGYVDVDTDNFRPSVTLTPASGQSGPLTVVAQRIRFELLASAGGLNGIYEYDPNEATVNTDFSTSVYNAAGMGLEEGAVVNKLSVHDGVTYVAGNFTSNNINNVFSIGDGNATSLPGGGLNSEVLTVYQGNDVLYMGGNFTNTAQNNVKGLNSIAVFSIADNKWEPLGTGVNGPVWSIVPMQLNITNSVLESVLVISGGFSEVYAAGSNGSFPASGITVWVISRKNWLHNIAEATVAVGGGLTTQTEVPGSDVLYAGSVNIRQLGMSDAVSLSGSTQSSLGPLGVSFQESQQSPSSASSIRKRAISSGQNITGVAAGIFYVENNMNLTILGGHFTANASDGSLINNFLVMNETGSRTIKGLPNTINANSQFLAMDTKGTQLWAGGSVSGTASNNDINGVIVYDLSLNALAATQPPALAGPSVTVNAIASQPSSANVYVGGSFSNAGSLSCGTLCMYDTSARQWMSPGSGLAGAISSMIWSSNNQLIISGNLTVNGNSTSMATYNSKSQTFQEFTGASSLPGPISALAPANAAYDQFWVAGTRTGGNNSYFLSKYDGKAWTTVGGMGEGTSIRGLQLMGVTQNHASSTLVDNNKILLVTGNIELPDSGTASAVLFNGTAFQPLVLTNMASGGQGTLARMFVQNPGNFLTTKTHHLKRGYVVLIALAIALGLIFLIVVAGIIVERYRRKKEGYTKMNDAMRPDQHANLARIPPESLFGTLREKNPAPHI